MPKSLFVVGLLCLCLMAAGAQGQNLFLVPGQNSNANNITVVSGSSFTTLGNLTAGAGSFTVLAKPDGSKYYVVANQGSQTVTALDSSFANPRSLGNLGLAATAGAITPDGRRLVVVAGTLHVFDTTTDNDLLPNGLNPGSTLIDVAISLDGSRAFVLGTNVGGGSTLFAVDLSSNTVIGTLPVVGTATAVTVGPNGLVYVSTVNQLVEVNPATLVQTPGGLIPLNARPGKLVFTPDGKFALAPNQTPITGSSVLVFDLAAHTVLGTLPNFNTVLDKLFIAGNNLVFAYSSQTQSLYQISLVPLTINGFSIPGVVTSNITAAAVSGEIAGGTRATAQFLYFVSGNTLNRFDVAANQASGQLTLPTAGSGAISIAGPANTTGAPTTVLQYNNNQVVAAGGLSAPLVVRVLDAQGRPVSGATITFASTNAGVTVLNPSVTTSTDGFAFTPITAPSTSGLFTVSASFPGGQPVNFSLGVGTGTMTNNSAQISILAGQGQAIFENQRTGLIGNSSMFIVVKDITGAPVAGTPVTFSIAQGPGSLGGPIGSGNGPTVTTNTDNTGQAFVDFLSSPINPGSGFQQTTITANAPGTNTVSFYITTTPQTSPLQVQFQKPQLGDSITGQAGSTSRGAFIVKVVSILGAPVPNVGIRVANGGPDNPADPAQFPSASCADPNGTGVLSDANGTITCDLVFGPKTGNGTLQGNVGYYANSPVIPFTVTPGMPAAIRVVQGNNQSGSAGQTLPLAFRLQVTDAGGTPLGGIPVSFQVIPAGAVILTNVSSATDQSGNASALGRLGTLAGTAQIRVTAGPASAIFNVTISIPVGGVQSVSGGGQTAVVNTAFGAPVVVKVVDPAGNPVAGTQVTFAVTSGSATLGTATATTNSSGQASTTVNAGAGVGPITISATSNGFSTSFSLNSRLAGPTNVTFLNAASLQPGVAPGAIITITGSGIATGIQGTVSANSIVGPLPTTFRGAQVLFNGIPAPIYSISNLNGQESITVQVPFELVPGSTATVTINAPGGGTATLNVGIDQFSPGVFETTFGIPNGQKFAVAIRASDGAYITPTNPAHPGETDCLFANGLGQVSPGTATNNAGLPNQNVLAPLDIGINNGGIRLVSATYLPGTVGVYLVCFQLPTDTATGPYQPIGLVVHDAAGNSSFAQGTFIPIL